MTRKRAMAARRRAEPDPALEPLRARTIVLVGLMGVGKTSVGRRLAARLGMPFHDSDEEIEAQAGLSVPEIFARFGEPAFRDGERKVIAQLLEGPPHVLATGGGAFMDAGTRAAVARHGVSVWLRAELALMLRRVGRRPRRPLLAGGDPRATLQHLMETRYPVYALADITVDSTDRPHEEAVGAIIAALKEWSLGQGPGAEARSQSATRHA